MTGNIFTELVKGYQKMRAISEMERISIHRLFSAFYNNDYLLINDILKNETLNNPYSKETLDKINFQHLDVTQKILSRLSGGIYTNEPLRELIISENNVDENLSDVLRQVKYSMKVKDAFRKALYFNVIVAQPVFDYELNKMRIDVFTPDSFKVKTKDDYLVLDEISIEKARPDGSVYEAVWTETEHYLIEGNSKEKIAPPNNEQGKNPFGKLPFVILRIKEGCDFFGEPNWNLLLNQKNLDIRLTDLNESELRNVHGIYHGINTRFPNNTRFTAGNLLQSEEREGERVSLESVNLVVDYEQIRDNIDWKIKTVMNSEGLSAQSGSSDVANESGVKRAMDEIELQEKRDDYKELLYNFEIELLNMIRLVHNAYMNPKLNDKATFELTFSEEKGTETIQDKIARREMEKTIGYKNDVDFTMEDLEVSEDEAIEILNKVFEQNKKLSELKTDSETDSETEKENSSLEDNPEEETTND